MQAFTRQPIVWQVLHQDYALALIDILSLSPIMDGTRIVTFALHTRGPLDVDMPAYTLRGYSLRWAVISPDGSTKFSEGDVPLPTLALPHNGQAILNTLRQLRNTLSQ